MSTYCTLFFLRNQPGQLCKVSLHDFGCCCWTSTLKILYQGKGLYYIMNIRVVKFKKVNTGDFFFCARCKTMTTVKNDLPEKDTNQSWESVRMVSSSSRWWFSSNSHFWWYVYSIDAKKWESKKEKKGEIKQKKLLNEGQVFILFVTQSKIKSQFI